MRNGIDIPLIHTVNGKRIKHINKGKGTIIAFIDSGIDVLHKTFQDNKGKTRIIAIWDQTDNTGSSPHILGIENSFGTEHREAQINSYIENMEVPPTLGRDPTGHGTLVASIAAGKAIGNFKGGIAPEAKIIVVKINPNDPNGLDTRHAQALNYIEQVAKYEGKPIVVNLSQGTNLGSRDGSAHHEIICNNFLRNGYRNNFSLVKSAGNQRKANQHSQLQGPVKQSYKILRLRCPRSCKSEELIELWFDFQNKFQFRLVNPSEISSDWVSEGGFKEGIFNNSENKFFIRYRKHSQNNPEDSKLLIVIESQKQNPIEQGIWKLEIKGIKLSNKSNLIDAWIERSSHNIAFHPFSFISNEEEDITLTTPGTTESLIVVGSTKLSCENLLSCSTIEDDKSSIGPTRKIGICKPTLIAPGIDIYGAKSGSLDEVIKNSGTSFATPHVSGAIALIFSTLSTNESNQSITQRRIIAGFRDTCFPQDQLWNKEKGFGILDLDNLYEHFLNTPQYPEINIQTS